MNSIVDSIFTEWRASLPEGSEYPNRKNALHIVLLKEICKKNKISEHIINDVVLFLEAEEKPLDDKEKEKAKKLGLVWKRKGYGPKDKKGITHNNVDGKLVAVGDDEGDKKRDGDKDPDIKKPKINPLYDPETYDADTGNMGGDKEKEESNIPKEQMEYYKELASRESKSVSEGDLSRAETGRRARVLYSKLQLIAAGEDVELNPTDRDNLGMLRISGKPGSGQLYVGSALDKDSGLQSASDKSPFYKDRNIHKNELLRKWPDVEEKLKSMGVKEMPKFKVGANYLIDKPPVIDHDPVSMKPNVILDKITASKGTDLLDEQTRADIEKNQGMALGEDIFFGEPLDPNNLQTFVNNINLVIDATRDYIQENAKDKTKGYFTGFVEDIDGIIEGDSPPETKLENIRSVIKEKYSALVQDAMELNESEGRNVLKDYGELATYMLYLSEGKETYLPKSGNYPLADIVIVNRDKQSGEALTIEGYSIKSQKGKEQQPGSSASEFLKHFSTMYPEHKEKLMSLEGLHVNTINKAKKVKDPEMVETLEKIKGVEKLESIDDMKKVAGEIFSEFGDSNELVDKFMKKVDRFHRDKATKYNIEYDMNGIGTAIVELMHREYAGYKTLSELSKINKPSRLKFIEVVVGDDDVDIREKPTEYSTGDFGLHDKGYLPIKNSNVDLGPPPRVKQIQYASANLALRTKKK